VRGGEDDDLIVFAQLTQDVNCLWANIDTCLYDFTMREGDGENYISWNIKALIAVNQGFV